MFDEDDFDEEQEIRDLERDTNKSVADTVRQFLNTHRNAHKYTGKMDPECETCIEFADITLQLSGVSPENQRKSASYLPDGPKKEEFLKMCDKVIERRATVPPMEQDLWKKA